MIEEPVDVYGKGKASPRATELNRARRLFAGWSANLVQMVLGVTQQVALVPVFLYYWTGDILAAWLAIYAAGNLIFIADAGLQFRAINRFLGFKSSVDCDGRTARFYAAMLQIYLCLVAALVIPLLAFPQFMLPSSVFGFGLVSHFDAAFMVMTVGTLLTLPSHLVSGLYRARGFYGRAVKVQSVAILVGQLGQLVAIVTTESLLVVTVVYVVPPMLATVYLLALDAPRLFPFLQGARRTPSWRWAVGQMRKAAPFAVASGADLMLLNLPVLLVSAFVSDRVAVAQWGLTRVVAGLVRALCIQTTLPLAAELGHDYAIGAKQQLPSLYARGSVLVALLASVVVSGLLPFWQDFFAVWTRDAIPFDPLLAVTLLIGTAAAAPSILALSYAHYSNRGQLLLRTKGLQLVVFLLLALILIPSMGPLGAAIAVVASDLLIQSGVLGFVVIGQTLQHPLRHIGFLTMVMSAVILAGWMLGVAIQLALPLTGTNRFFVECGLWFAIVVTVASPLAIGRIRERLIAGIPR